MSCSCSNVNAAVITPVLAAGSVASPYAFEINIAQRLCFSTCAAQTPVFNPVLSLVGYSSLGNGMYVARIHVEGVISYIPCSRTPCCSKVQVLSQDFTLPFYSATAPTAVSISQGTAVNAVAVASCKTCSRSFVSEVPLQLTVTTA